MLSQAVCENSGTTQCEVDQVLKLAANRPEQRDLVARLYKTFSRTLLDIMDELPGIKGINAAEGSELVALIAEAALKRDPLVSKRALLKLRGQMAFRQQIEEAGGVLTTQQVAALLGITPGAARKRLERGRLLAVPFGEGRNYPVWQFDENGVVEHFSNIMAMINTSSPVGMVQFFLTYDEDLGKTPIDALKGGDPKELEIVKILARQFNQSDFSSDNR